MVVHNSLTDLPSFLYSLVFCVEELQKKDSYREGLGSLISVRMGMWVCRGRDPSVGSLLCEKSALERIYHIHIYGTYNDEC